MVIETEHIWTATDRQREVLQIVADAPRGSTSLIGYGGAAGGAKTNLIANLAVEIATTWPGSRTLVGRQNFVDLRTTTLYEFDQAVSGTNLVAAKYDSAPVYREFRNGSRVYFRNLDDWRSLMSDQFGWVLIDEASETDLRAIMALISRLRDPSVTKWGVVAGFNPFPSWPVEWFMRRRLPENFDESSVRVHFVRARIEDNPHLRAGYRAVMEATQDEYMRAVLVEGDPDAALGKFMYFNRELVENLEKQYASIPDTKQDTRANPIMMADGHVLIWEMPVNGERYYIGADTADGKAEELDLLPETGGSDRNAAAVYRMSDDVQVAAIYGRQEEHVYAKLLNDWGRAYNNAALAVERNRRPVLSNLRQLAYPNLYYSGRSESGDQHLVSPASPMRQIEYGWQTTSQSRPGLLDEFREALHAGRIKPRDPDFYREAYNFLAGSKPQAAPGQHDDRVIAHAVAFKARAFAKDRIGQRRSPRMMSWGSA